MIARVLTTFTTAIALSSAAFAQQPAPPRETVGTTGTTPAAETAPAPGSIRHHARAGGHTSRRW